MISFVFACVSCLIFSSLFAVSSQTEAAFTRIYDNAEWGENEEGKGVSGCGSNLNNVQQYMKFLENFLKAHNIQSVVDVGCGDWSFSQHISWGDINYSGYDIVLSVIEANRLKFGTENIKFFHADALSVDLPKADLLICKEVLQHLPLEDIAVFLTHLHKFKHCLIINDVDRISLSSENRQISAGGYRTLDLTAPPFNVKGIKVFTYPVGGFLKQVLYIPLEVSKQEV